MDKKTVLAPKHLAMLCDSGITADSIRLRGYRTVTESAELLNLGFKEYQARVPCLLVPIHAPGGDIGYHIRPDNPRLKTNAKPNKYEFPEGWQNRLDVPPAIKIKLADPAVPLWVTEGSKKADSASCKGLCCIALIGVWNFRGKNEKGGSLVIGDFEAVALKGREVVIAFDSDALEKDAVCLAEQRLAGFLAARGAKVRIVRIPPGPNGEKVGLDDYLAAGGSGEELLAHSEGPGQATVKDKPDTCGRVMRLIEAAGVEIWRGSDGEAHATIEADGVPHHVRVKSERFREHCSWLLYRKEGHGMSDQVYSQVSSTLSAKGKFEGNRYETAARIAWHDDTCYLFLADEGNRVVEITGIRWRIVSPADCPVRFIDTETTRALPEPVNDGNLGEMHRFVNVADADWPIVEAFLVMVFLKTGTFPIFVSNGEQGSGKTFGCRMIRRLVDPVQRELRKSVKNGESLMAAAASSFMLGFDNLRKLPDWLSDSLCSIASGTALQDRKLYSNLEEVSITAHCPIILNGICAVATEPDLLDRALCVEFCVLDEEGCEEEELEALFEVMRPKLLGALLDRVVHAIATYRALPTPYNQRLRDGVRFALASVEGSDRTAMEAALLRNRQEVHSATVSDDLFVQRLMKLIDDESCLAMPASELLVRLGPEKSKGWPETPGMAANHLRRVAPVLRKLGYVVEQAKRTKHSRPWRLTKASANASPSSSSSPALDGEVGNGGRSGDSHGDVSARNEALASPGAGRQSNTDGATGDAGDKGDAPSQELLKKPVARDSHEEDKEEF